MSKIPNITIESEISTSLSTQVVISVSTTDENYVPVGAIKKFHVFQNRVFHQEKHDDGTCTLLPGPYEIIIKLERVVFDRLSMTEAFGVDYSIANQSRPFSILVFDVFPGINKFNESNKDLTTVTTYHNCWFSTMSTPFNADDYIVLEEATILCERISTQRK